MEPDVLVLWGTSTVEEEKNGYDRRQTPLPRHSLLSHLLRILHEADI